MNISILPTQIISIGELSIHKLLTLLPFYSCCPEKSPKRGVSSQGSDDSEPSFEVEQEKHVTEGHDPKLQAPAVGLVRE